MKNKKGFTLIELLAVIIILGLLIAIAFPAVSKYIVDTRQDTYSLHEAELKSATANMMSECVQGNVDGCVPDNGESRTIYLDELIAQKYSDQIKDPANTEHYCSESDTYVVVTNSTNNVVNLDYQVCLVCSEYKSEICETVKPNDTCDKTTDPERPVCGEAVGSSTVWTNADRIISIGCSDTGCGCTQGTFYKRFEENAKQGVITVVDKAGNSTDCVVDVYVDKEVPTCELTVEGSLGENGWYGGSAPVVKLTYNSSDISGIATYGMGVSSKNYDLNKKTSYTVSAGITTVYGYVKDNAGNVGTCSVPVQYDPVVPTGEITYGYQVYPKDDIATVSGQNIKLNNFIEEYGNVLGANIYLKSNTGGMSVTIYKGSTEIAKRTISAGVTFMKFSFTGTYDGLTIDMGSASNIALIDRVELITDQTVNGFYTNQDVIVYAASKDSFSGKGYYSFDGSSWQTNSSYTYGSNVQDSNVKIKDYAGNVSDPVYFDITNIDKEVPSCNITTDKEADGKNDWFISNFGLTLHTSDIGVSNVRDYNITTNSTPSYGTTTKGTQTEDTKKTTWHGYVRDHAGNVNRCSIDVKLDKVDPVCEILPREKADGENGWYISTVDIYYTEKDDTSGIVFRGMNTTGTVEYNMDTEMTLDYDTKGESFYCYVEDESGRTNSHDDSFKRDTVDPTCVITPDRAIDGENGWYIKDVTLTFSTDSETSPITGYDFINSSTFSYANKRYTHSITKSTEGVTYYGYTKEESGRTNTCEYFVKMDEDKPRCTLTDPGADGENGWYKSNINFTLNTTDNFDDNIKNTGIVSSNTKTYNGKTSLVHSDDKTNIQYWGFVEDDAGNEGTCVSEVEKKDSTAPDSCTLTITSGTPGQRGWYVSNVGIGLAATPNDSGTYASGIQGYDITIEGGTPTYSDKDSTFTVTANSTSTSGTNYVASIKDKAGNVRTCKVNVKKDDEAPRCSLYKVGTSGDEDWYRSGVTTYIDVFDNLGNSTSSMFGYGVSTSTSPTYNSEASYYLGSQTSGTTVYCYVEDQAGNVGQGSDTIKIDWTAPACKIGVTTGTRGAGSWYTSYRVVLSFVNSSGTKTAPTDASSGIANYYISYSTTPRYYSRSISTYVYSNTPASGRVYYGYVKDKAGNTNSCSYTLYKDSTAPNCSIEVSSGTEGANGWYIGSSVGIKGTPSGESGNNSGISSFDVTTSSTPSYSITYGTKTYTTVYQYADTTADGISYYCHVKDKAGNTRTTSALVIKKDSSSPTCELSTSGSSFWNTLSVNITTKGASSFGMSVDTDHVTYNGISSMAVSKGTHNYYGYVKDDAGNTGKCGALEAENGNIFAGDCTLSFSRGAVPESGWYTSTGYVSVVGNSSDKYEWTVNGASKGESTTISLSSDGQYYVHAKKGTKTCDIMVNIDTTPPDTPTVELSRTASKSEPSNGYVYATLSSQDSGSGLASWSYYSFSASSWTTRNSSTSPYRWYFFGEKNHTGYFKVCDAAGNCSYSATKYIYIDYCSEALEEENYSAYGTCQITCDDGDTDCSSTCGTGVATRYNTWTGDSGATCTVEETGDCTEMSGCQTSHLLCATYSASVLFGSSIGYNTGNPNYGDFYENGVPLNPYGFQCSSGCWTYSGYDRICSNYGVCGSKYFGATAVQMYLDDFAYVEENGGELACNFEKFWCTCDDNYLLGFKGEGDFYGRVNTKWYGG